jgi:SpoVK/Ycf46/Vps4 family AAA+-type ATPase
VTDDTLFIFANTAAAIFALANLSEVIFNPDIFDSLVLKEEQKRLVRDLVIGHQATGGQFDDVVRFKGKGLIGLLAGPPGVGKTMTAEAIAEVTERPLYVISSGELGEKPEYIHKRLSQVMELAELWRAVVLLDEADVFLSKRSDTDLTRNAIVSIFLRELEYYQGILILTTNRLPSFDPAFQSRIHFSLDYPDLDATGRQSIWKTFLTRAAEDPKLTVDVDYDGHAHLASLQLNGRQIKNVMGITQSVAKTRSEPITVSFIEENMNLCVNVGPDYGQVLRA